MRLFAFEECPLQRPAPSCHDCKVMQTLVGYLDPGAGSLFLQMLLAGILGLGFTLKTYWRRLVGLFRREKKEDRENAVELPPEPPR